MAKPNSLMVDIQSAFKAGMVYVMLSRVCSLLQLFILGKLSSEKIMVCPKVKAEDTRMTEVSVNNNPTSWRNTKMLGTRVCSLNVRSLKKHINDVRSDYVLRQSDIICLQETWLERGEEESNLFELEGYVSYFNSQGRGKGIVVYIKEGKHYNVQNITTPFLQITKLSSDTLDIIAIYRSQEESLASIEKYLQTLVDLKKSTMIVGDFNICCLQKANILSKYLIKEGFKQLVKNATHIGGGKSVYKCSLQFYYINLFVIFIGIVNFRPSGSSSPMAGAKNGTRYNRTDF